jgi:hypothetical protein
MPLPVRGGDTVADDPLGKTPDKADATKNKVDETAQTPDYYLLRYFDFDVEADKQYAYRVFVLLHNPNFGLDPKVLENEESAKSPLIGPVPGTEKRNDKDEIVGVTIESRYLEGWSKKCDSPKLPGDLRLLAGPTAPPKVPSPQEFTGETRILLWGEKLGLNQNCSKALQYRGTRLDFSNADMKTPGQTRTTKHDVPTNCLLVDLAGGELLSPRDRDRSPLSPGAMLVLDETGNLVIHDEMNDALEWTNATKEPERRGSERAPPVPRLKPGKAEIDTRGLDLKDQIRH